MSRFLIEMISFVALLFGFGTATAQYCDETAGILESVLVDEQPVLTAEAEQVSLRRDGSNVDVTNGMVLCPHDEIYLASGISVQILAGENGDSVSEITIVGEASAEIESRTSLLAKIGRFFGLIRGRFSVRGNDGATYGAQGTQFEIAFGDETTVSQLDGRIEYTPPPGSIESSLTVEPLQQLRVPQRTSREMPTIESLSEDECTQVTRLNSELFLRSRPRQPLRNSIETLDRAERADKFIESRQALLCDKDAAAILAVSQTYSDLEHPGIKFDSVPSIPPELSNQEKAQLAADWAESYRLAGRYDQSISGFRNAITFDATYAVAYLGMGRAVRDRSLAALNSENPATRSGLMRALLDSERNIRKSLEQNLWGMESEHNRAVGLIELGDVMLLGVPLDTNSRNSKLARAERLYLQAQELTGNNAPFAEIGLARVDLLRAELIPDTKIVGDDTLAVLKAQLAADITVNLQRRPFQTAARDRIRELLRQDRYQEFSAGEMELGQIYQVLGDRREARRHFSDAIQYNPNNQPAFFHLLETMEDDGDVREQRRMYRSAYRSSVPVQRQQINIALSDVRASLEVMPVQVDVLALVASPAEVALQGGSNIDDVHRPDLASVTLTNSGNQAVTVGTIRLGGKDPSAFTFDASQCLGQSLNPEADCIVRVALTQQSPGDYSAVLVVPSSSGVDARIELQGSVSEPEPQYVVQ